MNRKRTIAAVAVLGAALTGSVIAFTQRPDAEPPALPEVPQAVGVELVEATAFELDEPTTHWYRAERPAYSQGWLLVLKTDPEQLVARQTLENVLYVGAETAERVNVGAESGHLVAIVPGDVDLAAAPIFFGEPALPEQVTAAEAARQAELALDGGTPVVGEAALAAALQDPVYLADGYELRRFASYSIERFAPTETDVITGLRAERIVVD